MRKTREAYVENVEQYEIHKGWKEYGNIMDKDKKGRPRNGGC